MSIRTTCADYQKRFGTSRSLFEAGWKLGSVDLRSAIPEGTTGGVVWEQAETRYGKKSDQSL